MKKLTLIVSLFIGLLVWQSYADAASISTRVRILESKVYKQDKQIEQQARDNQSQSAKLDQGLREIKKVKSEVEQFMQDAQKKKSLEGEQDNRYSFP